MTISVKIKDPRILGYFAVSLGLVAVVGYYGPFFHQLQTAYGRHIAVLLYVGFTQGIAFSAGLLFQRFRVKTNDAPLVPDHFESIPAEPVKQVSDVRVSDMRVSDMRVSDVRVRIVNREKVPKKIETVELNSRDNAFSDAERGKFKIQFEQAHPDFFETRKIQYPSLSNNEIWLLAYMYLKLSNKEIAALLNIDAASVRRAKTRLNRKTGL